MTARASINGAPRPVRRARQQEAAETRAAGEDAGGELEEPPPEVLEATGGAPPAAPAEADDDDARVTARRLNTDGLLKLLAEHGLEVFRTPEGTVYCSLRLRGVLQTQPLERLRTIARHLAYLSDERSVSGTVLDEVLGLLEGRSHEAIRRVWVRLASTPGHVFLDLADGTGRVIDIDASGWRLTSSPPVTFYRPGILKPLPEPVRGAGSLDALRDYLQLGGPDWRTVQAFLLSCLMPPELDNGKPCPRGLLLLTGEHGTGKTVRAEALVGVIDPRTASSAALPESTRDLAIHAQHRWVLLFDNHSGSPRPELSDALCRLVDGSGFSTRALRTDSDEVVFGGSRPIIVTGIDVTPNRPDLLSRCLSVELPPLPEDARATGDELARRFSELHPGALAELCDLVAKALAGQAKAYRPTTRLASVEKWLAGAELALGWVEGDARALLERHATEGQDLATEEDPVAQAVLQYLTRNTLFVGNTIRFLEVLNDAHQGRFPLGWPETPKGLSSRLRRALPGLRARGVEYQAPDRRRSFKLLLREVAATATVATVATVGEFEP